MATGGGFAILVVEIEERPVLPAGSHRGELRGEKRLQCRRGVSIDVDVDRDGLAGLGDSDAMPTRRHVVDIGRSGAGIAEGERGGKLLTPTHHLHQADFERDGVKDWDEWICRLIRSAETLAEIAA